MLHDNYKCSSIMEHRRNLPLAIQANDLNNLKINGRLSTQCRAPHCANASRTAIQIIRRELSVGPVDVVRPWLRSERAAASGRRFVVLNVTYVGVSSYAPLAECCENSRARSMKALNAAEG